MPAGFRAIGKSAISDIRRKPGCHVLSCNGVSGRLGKHQPGAP
jgi:hypothetical protein